ncbi:MAG: bifunctional (p)ppGpp synthetase/guanosine-3',5'-bis(diphosphate) 3'-pyrophosphohydrolase [Clostridiales bacterium]|nr:bifunctional (p)ppGpp synthetase/guanosine-3',5'-bis(diphosphate) 3'-pyrophosphohydrolase [Clostridiales bacterium]
MAKSSWDKEIEAFRKKLADTFANPAQLEPILNALDYAAEMHRTQLRDSGEPYITHPVAVASVLFDMGLDYHTLAAALLHDCLEDTAATEEELKKRFGGEVTELVKAVTKLDKIAFSSKEEEQAENFRRMFMAMAKDIRVIIIKLADRLHNMRTIGGLTPQRQTAMATETLEIFAPLASRLGLSYLKCELEDLCLKVLHPDIYERLVSEIALKRAERQELVNHICARLTALLKELNIKGEVSGRPKHFYSIYKKMVVNNRSFEQIYDLTAVRVIVENVRDCYEVLGMIHTMWKPIPGRFKDFIAVPKANNYQSLHTTVMTSYGMPFEIQIRTYEMHKIAEYGIAAHWKYKENRSASTEFDEKLEWLRGVMDVPSDSTSPQEFYESLKVDLFSGQVFVFTPKGDVITLPEGSGPVDFAYSVHSEVGNHCVGAKINSKIVPLETRLSTGDYIEVITAANAKGPSRDWLRFVKTSQAKSKIRAFFKKELKEENIKRGREMLEKEAKNRGYTLSGLMVPKWLDVIMQRYSITSIDDLYASVGYGGFTVNQILSKLIDFYKKEQHAAAPVKTGSAPRHSISGGVVVKGHDDLLVRISKCCNPVPGDEIVGFISRGRGVAIHRSNCPNLKNVEDFRLIEAHWTGANLKNFVVSLQVEAKDHPSLLSRITTAISEMKLSITNMYARTDKNGNAIINLNVSVETMDEFDLLIKKLGQLPHIDKVFRSSAG